MSYILDALKKSERDRTLVRGIGFGDAGRRLSADADWLLWLIAGIALVAVAAVAVTFSLRGRTATPASVVSASAASTVSDPVAKVPAVADTSATVGEELKAMQANKSAAATNPVTQAPPALMDIAPVPVARVASLTPPMGEAKFLLAMSPDFQRSVPAMEVNIHVYTPDESQRILYINNRQYRRNDEIPGGVVVEEIVADGVVLQYQGQRFKLPRPS